MKRIGRMRKKTTTKETGTKDGLSPYVYKKFITGDGSHYPNTHLPLTCYPSERQQRDSTTMRYVDFACNGRYLACVQVRRLPECRHSLTCGNSMPPSQLILLEFVGKTGRDISQQKSRVNFVSDIEDDFQVVASHNLNLIEVYFVTMSSDTTQIAIHGFSYNDTLRKPSVTVYEIVDGDCDEVSLVEKARLVFYLNEILFARVTVIEFLPSNNELLITSVCNDYHTVRRTNHIDLWDTKLNRSITGIDLVKECPRFQGYVSSMALTRDSTLLALVSSTENWQLVLYSMQKKSFSDMTSLQKPSYNEPIDHFASFCEFCSNGKGTELLVCTAAGELSKFSVDLKTQRINCVIFSTKIVDNVPDLGIAGFKYIPANSMCVFKMQEKIRFADAQTGTILKGVDFEEQNGSYHSCCLAVSKMGTELAFIKDRSSISIIFLENEDISLKNLCRCAMIQLVPENKILQLDLPKTLSSFLLYGKC